MKRKKGLDIFFVLASVLWLCATVGLLRVLVLGIDIEKRHFATAFCSQASERGPEHIMRSLQPLLESRNLGMLAGAVGQFGADTMCSVASLIVQDARSSIAQEDKLPFLLMLAHRTSASKIAQHKLFDLMLKTHLFDAHSSLLSSVAKKDYMAILPSFIAWLHRDKIGSASFSEERLLIDEAIYSAIEQDDLSSLEKLSASGIQIDAQRASDLLMRVVYDRKKSAFIPFLIHRGADVNRVGPDRYTLVSKAISYNDLITVRTLLEAGADVDLQVDETIGSARRLVQVSGNRELEKLIAVYGVKA